MKIITLISLIDYYFISLWNKADFFADFLIFFSHSK